MDVRILGGLSVCENGVSITPTAAAPRQVLALLAASADQVVPATVLMAELWPSGGPRGARAELHAHITGLRALIAAALHDGDRRPGDGRTGDGRAADGRTAETVLAAQSGGYRLDTGGGSHDVGRFERAAGAGYRAMEAGDLSRAALRLGEALALWRGEPYEGVAAGPRLRAETVRLAASRMSVLDQWVEAQLGLGKHAEMVPELATLVARHPVNEALHAQFMVALLRSGRTEDALDVYQRLCGALLVDGDREPSARLRRLYRSLLTVRDGARPPRVPAQAPGVWARTPRLVPAFAGASFAGAPV
ncbi:AfsR/SARP family transcriptional regulator [Streptomyces sp. SKN60]|uniref:AfsR/SARP family transcriptional regulator n=1 Tax=Streptomyces sp. SKN60 TaxID=2855506 RepID=UPI002247F6E3|nr:AfsR/SARP family transcriptional regulator [Streptomyces sp. SKN60]MCX2179976.1 AfsR/SARP family transcriptional regulator [Streptomyces sp. SKN60]